MLLPYALEGCYSYSVPPHLEVAAGDFVHVPLGTRQTIGVVWREQSKPVSDLKLKPITARCDGAAARTVAALHRMDRRLLFGAGRQHSRLCLRVPGELEGRRDTVAYVASDVEPDKLTPQRARVLAVARQGMALRRASWRRRRRWGQAWYAGLPARALREVALSPFQPFSTPEPLGQRVALNSEQTAAAEELRRSRPAPSR